MYQIITEISGSVIYGRVFDNLDTCLKEIDRLDGIFSDEIHYYVKL